MDFRVEIKEPAIADLAEIVTYIAQGNPDAASALGNNLLDAALSLARTPDKGSPYPKLANIRKLTLRPYKISIACTKHAKQSRFSASGTRHERNLISDPPADGFAVANL